MKVILEGSEDEILAILARAQFILGFDLNGEVSRIPLTKEQMAPHNFRLNGQKPQKD